MTADAYAIATLRDGATLARLAIDPGLGALLGYPARPTDAVRQALARALRPPAEALVALDGGTIIGYLLVGPAAVDQPWGRLGDPRILDVSVEVARGHRGRGVATALFGRAFVAGPADSRIHIATGYVWCWDLAGTGTTAVAYADRLLRLFERFGFRHEWTSEPNIAMEPANFLAVRIGRLVPPALVRRFRQAQRGEAAA